MIFSKEKIEQIMEMVDFQHLHFCIYNIGTKFLTKNDKSILKKYGINVDKIDLPQHTPSRKAYLFGKLAASLREQTKKIDYNDFLKYLRRGQYVPLSRADENVLDLLETKLAESVLRESNKIKQEIQTLLIDRNLKWNMDQTFKDLVKEEIKVSTIENRTKQELVLEIGHKTEKWEKDIGRIADTELQDIYQYGKLAVFSEITEDGEDLLVYKNVYAGACKSCISLYLTEGIGSAPIIYKISELIKNGTNIGRTQKNWKPVIGTTHPWCRCELEKYIQGDVWAREKQVFTIPKTRVTESRKIKGEIKITIGDKIIIV